MGPSSRGQESWWILLKFRSSRRKVGGNGDQLGHLPAFSLLWHPVQTFLSSFPQDPVWPRRSLSLNHKSLYRRQAQWPWTVHIAPEILIICSGTNSLPAGRWFSLFAKMLMNNRMQPTIATLWTSRKKPKHKEKWSRVSCLSWSIAVQWFRNSKCKIKMLRIL